MKISLLAAYTKNKHIIGAQGKIPWKLPSERDYFKKICQNKYVIMGRKSFDEIGKPLSYCNLIVLSRKPGTVPGVQYATNLEEAFELCKNQEEILIAGGQTLYQQTIDKADTIYATEINLDIEGDSFFPAIDDSWKKELIEKHCENNIDYQYVIYKR